MQNEFRRLKFGVVPSEFRGPQVDSCEQVLISYIRTAHDYSLQTDINATVEIFSYARKYIGKSFQEWLIANYNNGTGSRAGLVRRIVSWIEGKVTKQAITGEVKRDLNRIAYLDEGAQLATAFIFDNSPSPNCNVNFAIVKDRHFFEILAILGPELTAQFLLSLNGIRLAR